MDERIALFAPIYDPRQPSAGFLRKLNGRPPTAIAAGSLTLSPGARVLLEHNRDKPVGRVRHLFRMPWTDRVTWHAALLELDDDGWPSGQPVSISYAPLRETMLLDGRRIIERGLVNEISITSTPAIAGARLLPPTLRRTKPGRPTPPQPPRKLIRNCGEIIGIR